jgi:hypothetical protein
MSGAQPMVRRTSLYRVVLSNASGVLDTRSAYSKAQAASILLEMVSELAGHIEPGDTFTVEGPSEDECEAMRARAG